MARERHARRQYVARLAVLPGDRVEPVRLRVEALGDRHRRLGVVELRARVVRHPAVDRHVRRRLRGLLDDADAVERHAGGPDDRSPGLDDQLRLREPDRRPLLGYAVAHDTHELRDPGNRILRAVPDPESAADVEHAWRPVELGAARCRELRSPVDARARRVGVAKLRAEVHVDARDLEAGAQRFGDRRGRGLRRQPELRAVVRRADRGVRVDVDPRSHANEYAPYARRDRALDLVGGVEHDVRDIRSRPQLLVALVVAVHDDPLRGNAGPPGKGELAERRDVRAQALLREP